MGIHWITTTGGTLRALARCMMLMWTPWCMVRLASSCPMHSLKSRISFNEKQSSQTRNLPLPGNIAWISQGHHQPIKWWMSPPECNLSTLPPKKSVHSSQVWVFGIAWSSPISASIGQQDVIWGSRPKVPFGMVSYWGQRCSQPIPRGLRWIWDCSGHFRRKQVLDCDDANGRMTLHLLCQLPWAWLEPLFPQRRR